MFYVLKTIDIYNFWLFSEEGQWVSLIPSWNTNSPPKEFSALFMKAFLQSFFVFCAVLSHIWLFVTLQAPLSIGILQARILKWVAMPSSRASSQPNDRTQVSYIAGGFFTIWSTREPEEYWSVWPIPSPGDLWTGVSSTANRFFMSWATREALLYFRIVNKVLEIPIVFTWAKT